jgi:hypothetical protein
MEVKGCFRGTVIDGAVSVTKNGFAQAVIKVRADEMYDDEEKEWGPWDEFSWEPNEIDDREGIIYACIFGSKGPTFVVDDLKEIFGWDGTSLGALDSLMAEGVKIQWSNDLNTYEGATSMKSDGIKAYDAEPGTSLKKLDAKGLAELDAKFANFLKGETKAAKPAAGKRKSRKKADKAEAPVEEAKTEEPKADKPKRGARGSKKKAKATAPPEEAPAESGPPPEEDETVAEQADGLFAGNGPCTKAEAWADINANKGDAATDGDVSTAWMEAIQNVGGGKKQKELTDEEWGSVRAAVIDVVAVF